MDALITYFESIPASHRSIILFGGLTVFLLLENASPLFNFKYNKWKHLSINLFFTFTTILVNFFMAFLLLKTSFWVEAAGVGLLQWINLHPVILLVVGLLLLDLVGAYTIHYIEHHVKWMWQFHVIHHTDLYVDASTSNRHHPGESVFRFIFTLLAIIIVGAPFWMVMVYQAMSAFFAQFTHWNIRLPKWFDSSLRWLFVTPDMHHVHHHYRQPYSDTNYGNIFSVWDRVFGTYKAADNDKLVYGVDTYHSHDETSDIWNLLKIPFAGYRQPIEYQEEENLS